MKTKAKRPDTVIGVAREIIGAARALSLATPNTRHRDKRGQHVDDLISQIPGGAHEAVIRALATACSMAVDADSWTQFDAALAVAVTKQREAA